PVVAPAAIPSAPQPLGPDEAKLIVWLEDEHTKLRGVSVYVDGARVGEAPWEGIVAPGEHRVRVEGAGYWSKTVRTKVWPKRTRMVQVELRPAGSFDVGHFYVGAVYSFGLGSAFIDGERYGMRRIGIGGGLSLGVKMPSSRLWWELGLTVGPFMFSGLDHSYYMPSSSSDYNEAREEALDRLTGEIMPFYLELRFLVPLKGPHVYWASSFLPGLLAQSIPKHTSDGYYLGDEPIASFSTTLRTGLAFILGDWWEIRLDVVGVELIFEKAFGVLYSPSFAIVLRI
ncbi:MAG: PEGA domain-containing protein, partial [Proteobacteria bacterium]|nr:PEGA domain-containing protein [Pseudomonadota bacterium]